MRVMSPAVEYVVNARWMLARAVHTALRTDVSARTLAELTGMTVDQVLGLADEFANG